MLQRVIRIADLATTEGKDGKLPVSPATIWRCVPADKFSKPSKLGQSVTVWDASEVDAFITRQAQGIGK